MTSIVAIEGFKLAIHPPHSKMTNYWNNDLHKYRIVTNLENQYSCQHTPINETAAAYDCSQSLFWCCHNKELALDYNNVKYSWCMCFVLPSAWKDNYLNQAYCNNMICLAPVIKIPDIIVLCVTRVKTSSCIL